MNGDRPSHPDPVLAIADIPGHIFERLANSWAASSRGARHRVICAKDYDHYELSRACERAGLAHWLDSPRFVKVGPAVRCPQVVQIHHITADMEELVIGQSRFADAITTGSIHWQKKLGQLTGRPVWQIPYTLDTAHFMRAGNRAALRREAGIREGEFVLGFVGKTIADHKGRKGTDLLLKILAAAGERWTDIGLVLVGTGWDALTKQIEDLGIHVKRYEYATSEETVAAYQLMDCLLLTSSEEGGPVTVLEAMACEVPVISSVVGHVPEVIKDRETGFLCPQREVPEYLTALQALRERPELSAQIQRAGRERVKKTRDSRTEVPKFDFCAIYREACLHYRELPWRERLARSRELGRLYFRHRRKERREKRGG